jgi:hypothetical protein
MPEGQMAWALCMGNWIANQVQGQCDFAQA